MQLKALRYFQKNWNLQELIFSDLNLIVRKNSDRKSKVVFIIDSFAVFRSKKFKNYDKGTKNDS